MANTRNMMRDSLSLHPHPYDVHNNVLPKTNKLYNHHIWGIWEPSCCARTWKDHTKVECGLMRDSVIGPFFHEVTVTGKCSCCLWNLHDGSLSHYQNEVCTCL